MIIRTLLAFVVVGAVVINCDPSSQEYPDSGGTSQHQGRPSFLIVSVDTLRADHTSLYGHNRNTTPFLDELAQQGSHFEIAYAPTSTTGPTHATLFTGLLPIRHGLNFNGKSLGDAHPTLGEALRDVGYETAAVVSSFVLDSKFGFGRGFDHYFDDLQRSTQKYNAQSWEGHPVTGGFDRPGNQTTDRAIEWLENRVDPKRPFLLFVHYYDPHEPYVPPPPFDERFGGKELVYTRLERDMRQYDGAIAFTDQEIGRLVHRLDELFDPNSTVVVVTADHGQGLMDHGDPFHSVFIYEEDVRVPLVFRGIGRIREGRAIRGPAGIVDIAPTLLEFAGIDSAISDPDGISLAETLRGGDWKRADRPMFLQRQRYLPGNNRGHNLLGELFGVREGRWKYVEGPREKRLELFDLESDPGESKNVVLEEPVVASKLAAKVHRWRLYKSSKPSSVTEEVSPQDRERLRAMGYVE